MFEDGLAGVESFGAAGLFGEKGEAFFDFGVEADGEHEGESGMAIHV